VPQPGVPKLDRLAAAALLAFPGALLVYLSFNGGGFFVAAPAVAAVAISALLVLRVTLAPHPFAGFGGPGLIVGLALALFAVWTLLSAFWSDAPARAILEFDRALLYLLVFVLFASLGHAHRQLQWVVRGLALAIAGVCVVALVTRLAPDVWPISANVRPERLSYPLTYWNSLGLMAAVGSVLCCHLTASQHEPRAVRLLGAAAVPVLATTLLLTFSRGSIAVAAGAVVVYAVVGRPRGLPCAVIAAGVPTAVAVALGYRADLLATEDYATPAGVAQGHDMALALVLCVAGAVLLRALLLPVDGFLLRVRLPTRARRPMLAVALVLAFLAVGAGLTVLDASAYFERQYDRFLAGEAIRDRGDVRGRLTELSNNGRIEHWRVALDGYREHPVHGTGAGTYQLLWARHRPGAFTVNDGHSLYVEVLGELGIVGLVLVATAILALLGGLVLRIRRRGDLGGRPMYAAVLAVVLAWTVHAGVDWDWEMPAVTTWTFALGGCAIAAGGSGRYRWFLPSRASRVAIALGLLVVAATPALAAVSQNKLDRSVTALKRGDCVSSIDAALDSIDALSVRPEPWELLGFCDSKLGNHPLALRALENAVQRDPASWEVHYGMALVLAAAGRDPRHEARRALARNPHEQRARLAVSRLGRGGPARWRRVGRTLPLPVP
jgi:O-antigen ligase